jgi:hypothetical protein
MAELRDKSKQNKRTNEVRLSVLDDDVFSESSNVDVAPTTSHGGLAAGKGGRADPGDGRLGRGGKKGNPGGIGKTK